MEKIIQSLTQLIFELIKTVYKIIPFTSQYGIVKYLVGQGTLLGIPWLDKALVSLASLLTTAIVWAIAAKLELNGKAKTAVSIIVFLLIITLFGNWIFWCIVGGIMLLTGILIMLRVSAD